jgi:hypothetical protein
MSVRTGGATAPTVHGEVLPFRVEVRSRSSPIFGGSSPRRAGPMRSWSTIGPWEEPQLFAKEMRTAFRSLR